MKAGLKAGKYTVSVFAEVANVHRDRCGQVMSSCVESNVGDRPRRAGVWREGHQLMGGCYVSDPFISVDMAAGQTVASCRSLDEVQAGEEDQPGEHRHEHEDTSDVVVVSDGAPHRRTDEA